MAQSNVQIIQAMNAIRNGSRVAIKASILFFNVLE
jgi:hypothetical protein